MTFNLWKYVELLLIQSLNNPGLMYALINQRPSKEDNRFRFLVFWIEPVRKKKFFYPFKEEKRVHSGFNSQIKSTSDAAHPPRPRMHTLKEFIHKKKKWLKRISLDLYESWVTWGWQGKKRYGFLRVREGQQMLISFCLRWGVEKTFNNQTS